MRNHLFSLENPPLNSISYSLQKNQTFHAHDGDHAILQNIIQKCWIFFEEIGATTFEIPRMKPQNSGFTIFMLRTPTQFFNENSLTKPPTLFKAHSLNPESFCYCKIDFKKNKWIRESQDKFRFDWKSPFDNLIWVEYEHARELNKNNVVLMNSEGIFIQMQKDLTDIWAQYIAISRPEKLQKWFCIDWVFRCQQTTDQISSGLDRVWEASFDICTPWNSDSGIIPPEQELYMEADVIQTASKLVFEFKEFLGYQQIVLNSSSIIDLILSEAEIPMESWHWALQKLTENYESFE